MIHVIVGVVLAAIAACSTDEESLAPSGRPADDGDPTTDATNGIDISAQRLP